MDIPNIEIAKIIGDRVRAQRNKLGLSQEELAHRANLHYTFVGALERAEKNATIETVYKICYAMNYPLELLFEKIIDGETENDCPRKMYDLTNSLSNGAQNKLYAVVKTVLDFKEA